MELRQRRKDNTIAAAVTKSLDTIKDFDLYPKLKDDHKKSEKTTTGAVGTGQPRDRHVLSRHRGCLRGRRPSLGEFPDAVSCVVVLCAQ